MVPWWLPVDLPNISANTDHFEAWLVSIERSFQGLSIAIKTVRIVEELVEIWLNEVYDRVLVRLLIQLLYSLCTTFPYLSCNPSYNVMWCDVTMTMWHLWCDTFPHSFLYSKSKRKVNINNNLAVLPSHNNTCSSVLRPCD